MHFIVGFGYVNHRSAYTNSTERVYGSHAHSGDVVGVCLDCDAGRLSFFIDGVKVRLAYFVFDYVQSL